MTSVLLLLTATAMGQAEPGVFRAGPVTLVVRPAPDRGAISLPAPDELSIVYRVTGSAALEVTTPSRWMVSRGWRLHPPAPAKIEKTADGGIIWQMTLDAYPTTPGEFSLALAPLVWKDGAREGTASFEPIPVRSFSTLDRGDIRNLRDPIVLDDPTIRPGGAFPWFNLALTGIGVLAGLFLALRGIRRRPQPKASAEADALRALDRINTWQLPEQGKGERYFALLSLIVRRYLERKHALPARHRTSRDLLDMLDTRPDLSSERTLLARFAEQADRAKFAPEPSTAQACLSAEREIRLWLEQARRTPQASATQQVLVPPPA